jgi:imidazoleglycerol-phosphate dehydratase
MPSLSRTATEIRRTKETDIRVSLDLGLYRKTNISTGIKLFDHMLELFAFHGFFDIELMAKGDLGVDSHHTVEDVGLVLGKAFKKALGDKKGIQRFGFFQVPMEGTTASVTVDINGRGFFSMKEISECPGSIRFLSFPYLHWNVDHFFDSFARNSGISINIILFFPDGDSHSVAEAIFKAFGLALNQAVKINPQRLGVVSTKGVID